MIPRGARATVRRRRITERDLILAAAGTLSALAQFLFAQHSIVGGGEPIAIAHALIRTGAFRDPFAGGVTGPTAHLAPLLPWVLALVFLLPAKMASLALMGGVCLAQGIQVALLPRISQVLFDESRPGMMAALGAVGLPLFVPELVWENLYSAAGVVAFCLLAQRPQGAANGARCGLAAGLLLLLNPSVLLLIVCWLAYALWASWPGFRSFCRFGAVFSAACLLVLLPWEIRNYRELGGFTFVRDNLGLELYAANNDCAGPRLIENLQSGCEKLVHPMFNAGEAADMLRMGELNYNRDRERRALAWISLHPARFRQLTAQRFRDFWFPPGEFWIAAITWLSLPGLAVAFWKRPKVAWFAVAALALYPLTYYVVQFSTRFRYPVLWITLLLAGYALHAGWRGVARIWAPGRDTLKVNGTR